MNEFNYSKIDEDKEEDPSEIARFTISDELDQNECDLLTEIDIKLDRNDIKEFESEKTDNNKIFEEITSRDSTETIIWIMILCSLLLTIICILLLYRM
jgi:hypothetical protein